MTQSKFRELKLDDPVTAGIITQRLEEAGAQNVGIWHRNVGDGELRCILEETPMGWHLSITHAKRQKKGNMVPGRWPRWDEVWHARTELLPEEIDVVMHLPREEDYVGAADTSFHLAEFPDRAFNAAAAVTAGRTPSGLILPR